MIGDWRGGCLARRDRAPPGVQPGNPSGPEPGTPGAVPAEQGIGRAVRVGAGGGRVQDAGSPGSAKPGCRNFQGARGTALLTSRELGGPRAGFWTPAGSLEESLTVEETVPLRSGGSRPNRGTDGFSKAGASDEASWETTRTGIRSPPSLRKAGAFLSRRGTEEDDFRAKSVISLNKV
jgi:hypothetical protein